MDSRVDRLTSVLGALADPHRRAILERLAQGEADVTELMRPMRLSQPAVSKHLKILEGAGLIAVRRDGQRRPRMLIAAPLKDVDAWLERYRRLWDRRFDRLDRLLARSGPKD